MTNILIVHSLPLNGGDQALLEATLKKLSERFPFSKVSVLCNEPFLCKRYMPHVDFWWDVDQAARRMRRSIFGRVARKLDSTSAGAYLAGLKRILEWIAARDLRASWRMVFQSDVIISSPGGFLHDYYEVDGRLQFLEECVKNKKKVILMAQSIGPFWKNASVPLAQRVLSAVDKITLREHESYQSLESIGVEMANIEVTADMAFLLNNGKKTPGKVTDCEKPPRIVAVCFREWNPATGSQNDKIEQAAALCRALISRYGMEVRFLSTCQGIDGYRDDSLVAGQILERLTSDERAVCTVVRGRMSPTELVEYYGACDAYIGMRLHGAILSMIGGVPALNIGYEKKTEGIYRQLGLEEYCVDYSAELDEWLRVVDKFFSDYPTLRKLLPERMERVARSSERNLDRVEALLE